MNNIVLHPYSLNSSIVQNSQKEESPVKITSSNVPSLQNLILKDLKEVQQQQSAQQQASQNQFYANNSPAYYSSQLQVGNKRFGSSYEVVNSMTNPFSTPELDDNIRLTNNHNNHQIFSNNNSQNRDSLSLNLQQNNLSTIKMKSYTSSYISNSSSGITLQGILRKQYEGAREGQEQRMKLFTFNEEMALVQQGKGKAEIDNSPVAPDNLSMSDKPQMSSLLNNVAMPNNQQQLQNSNNIHLSQNLQQQQQLQQLDVMTKTKRKESAQGTYKTGTIAYTQYRQRQRLWKNKWMIMSYFIAKSIHNFKKILILSKPTYLTQQQLNLINDKSAHYDKVRENKEKRYQGWLYNSSGCCSRRNKKRILIFLKHIRGIKNCVSHIYTLIKHKISDFDKKSPPFSPLMTSLKIFDFLMLILTVFIAFFIPLFICFHSELGSAAGGNVPEIILKNVSPFVFIVDILKYLNTGCFIRGQIINDRMQIFKNYMRERFICDAVSIVTLFIYDTYPVISNNFTLVFFYFRFYFGLHVIGKIRESFLLKDRTNAFINTLTIISFVIFYAHIFACLWFYIGVNQGDSSDEAWVHQAQLSDSSLRVKYLDSLYFAFTSISTLNSDIDPRTEYEKLFLIIINFISYGLIGYILYEAQQIYENLSQNKKNYLRQLKQINRYMSDHNVSEHYQSLARKYLQYVTYEGLDSRQVSADKSLQGLSQQLKEDIIKDSFINQLKAIRVFSNYFSEQFLEKLALKMGEQILGPDEYVINANKLQSPKIFIVKKGIIEFFVNIGTQRTNITDSLKSFKIFKENDYFGTYEFFSDTYKPHLSARSIGVSVVQYITLVDFLELLDEFPEEREAYSYIKEMVTIYKQLDIIGITCYSCGERDHQALSCPYLFYDQQRANILKKIDQETYMVVRNYQRKEKKKYNFKEHVKKIQNDSEKFVINHADELQSQSSMKSLEIEDNLQLNNIDLPKMDSQYLDSYFHIRGKTSSIGTLGTLRVREDQPPGNINNIYFDSDLDVHSMNSAYLKSNATKTVNEHDWNVNNNSLSSINQLQSNTNAMMLNQPINMGPLIPKTPSIQSALEEEDNTNYNNRKILSKLTSSPSRTSMNITNTKLPDLKYRSKSTHIKPSVGDSFVEEASSLIDIKSLGTAKSPRPNTVIIPTQKSDQPSLMRRNTTKTRNRVQSFNLDTTQYREGTHRSQRKQYEQSIFSQLQDNKTNNIEEESSFTDEEDNDMKSVSQKSYSYKDNARSDKQSKPSEKANGQQQQFENFNSYAFVQNNFSTVHSFRTFFPHNNIENVLEYLNRRSRGMRRARSKKITKKLSHRSMKKQSSLRSKKMVFRDLEEL